MTNPSKDRGDRGERELSHKLCDLLGVHVQRKLGAGRLEDTGDLHGLDNWTAQVADWSNVGRAFSVKPLECEKQQANAGTTYGVTFLRMRGGIWRAVQTLPQWATVYREQT